jgi:hypothetical protein
MYRNRTFIPLERSGFVPGNSHALIWRDGAPLILPAAEATDAELASGIISIGALSVEILDRYLRKNKVDLTDEQREDAISFLVSSCWSEAVHCARNGFDPERGRIGAAVILRVRWRLYDWLRADDRERQRRLELTLAEDGPDPVQVDDTELDAISLSTEARWALTEVAARLAAGWSERDVQRMLGVPRARVSAAMDALRAELVASGVVA